MDGFAVLALQMLPLLALTAVIFAAFGWSWKSKSAAQERLILQARVDEEMQRANVAEQLAAASKSSEETDATETIKTTRAVEILEAELKESQARQLNLEKELLRQRDERRAIEEKWRQQEVELPSPDDLTVIRGIGPVLAKKLEAAGIRTLRQIGEWTAADIEKWDSELSLRGRVTRDKWVAQAKQRTP